MKIKLLNVLASPAGCFPAGAVVDLPEKQAAEIISFGHAISLEQKKEKTVETSTAIPEKETADAPIVLIKKTATKKKRTVKK